MLGNLQAQLLKLASPTQVGMDGLGDVMMCSSIAITDYAGFPESMNFQFQPHLAANCVLPAVLDWLLFGLLYPFPHI